MARPALAVGLALVLLETLNDIGASEYLGVRTLTVSIFTTWLNRGSLAGAAQLSCLMLSSWPALMRSSATAAAARDANFPPKARGCRARTQLARRPGLAAACAACLLPVLFGFVVPLLFLIQQSIERGLLGEFRRDAAAGAFNSVVLATLATAIVLPLGFATISPTAGAAALRPPPASASRKPATRCRA